jgi:hypothetical protein
MDEKFRVLLHGLTTTLRPLKAQLIGLGIVCALGLAVALTTVFAPLPKDLTQDRWALTDWRPFKAGTLRDEVIAAEIWAESPDKKVKAPVAQVVQVVPLWRFVGTVENGGDRLAMIEVDGLRVRRMAVGDELPNGARIQTVEVGALTYADNGENRTLKLFDKEKPDDGKPKAK